MIQRVWECASDVWVRMLREELTLWVVSESVRSVSYHFYLHVGICVILCLG